VSARRLLFAAASFGFCMAGLGTLVQGAMVPAEAQIAQAELRRDFERDLKANVARLSLDPPQPGEVATRRGEGGGASAKASSPPGATPPSAQPAGTSPGGGGSKPIAPGKPLAKITVKRLAIEDVILAGPASHDDLTRGPMMVKAPSTESPVTVLAAHRDTHFLFIRDLREGDIVTLQHVTGTLERYRVTYFETVRWDEFAYPLDPARPLLALTTCYPFGGTEYGGPWGRVAWAERLG